jgi:hypothetical protein
VADYFKIIKTWPTDVDQVRARAQKYIGSSVDNILGIDRKELINDIAKRILLVHATQKYDPDVVMKLIKKLEPSEAERKKEQEEKKVLSIDLDDLKEGMVLVGNLSIVDGRLLLRRGTVLNKSSISTIHRLWKEKFLEGPIYVRIQRLKSEMANNQ